MKFHRYINATLGLTFLLGAGSTALAQSAAQNWPAAVAGSFVTAPALPGDPRHDVIPPELLLAAHAPELQVIPELRGVIFISNAADANLAVPAGFTGIDASRAALLKAHPGSDAAVQMFLGHPASMPSLIRIALVARLWLQREGESFVVAYVPPQDLTDGVVRVVVARAQLEEEVAVNGAKYFSAQQYRVALGVTSGAELNAAELHAATEALNQNPFRRVTAAVEAGTTPGTSRLALQVDDRLPLQVTAGYDNAGTPSLGLDQMFAGVTWGNAFGRGDILSYNFLSDLNAEHLVSHSGGYTSVLPWRHIFTLSGSWAKINGDLPAPLSQAGHSWQIDALYSLPLRAPHGNWTQNLSFLADFKSTDNNLQFAAIPITNNLTHVAKFGATYGATFAEFGGQNSAAVSFFASPGGMTNYDSDRAYAGSRPGAKASFAYGKINLSHRHSLPYGFAWITSADLQIASGALLGSEQLNGGGVGGVRGYPDSTAFGDSGIVVNNELHAPSFSAFTGRAHFDLFAFVDFASLNLQVDNESTDLRSAGLGVNYQFARSLTARAAYGWHPRNGNGPQTEKNGHGHISVSLSW